MPREIPNKPLPGLDTSQRERRLYTLYVCTCLQAQPSPGQNSVHEWLHHHRLTCCHTQSAHPGLASDAQHFLGCWGLLGPLQGSAVSRPSLRLAAVWAHSQGWDWHCAEPLLGLPCTAAGHTHTQLRSADHTLCLRVKYASSLQKPPKPS